MSLFAPIHTTSRVRYAIGLGGNVGTRELMAQRFAQSVERLLDRIQEYSPALLGASPLYETQPYGVLDQPVFLNGAISLEVDGTLLPPQLLIQCKAVELDLGRQARQRWGPRELDLDLLLMDPGSWSSPELTVPHKDLSQRMFALVPLCDLGWSDHPLQGPSPDPVSAETVIQAVDRLRRQGGVDHDLIPVFAPQSWIGPRLTLPSE